MRNDAIKLGLLDFTWVQTGQSPVQALADTLALVAHADKLGFARFWLGEHHVEGHGCGSPQILAALAAAASERIRIGVGAMLLQYWAPLKLAEDFSLLEALFSRIDLGVGRGRADSLPSHRALLDGRASDDRMLNEADYAARLDDVLGHLRGDIAPDHPHFGAPVLPRCDRAPEVWVCGSATAAPEAARTGTRFCCTLFHGQLAPPTHIALYKAKFRPSEELHEPIAAIAVAGVCAETRAEAIAIRDRFPNPNYLPSLVGSADQCRQAIEALCEMYAVNEVILLDIGDDRETRMRSAQLLAESMGLASELTLAPNS